MSFVKILKAFLFALIFGATAFAQTANQKFDYDSQLGMVATNAAEKQLCLAINNPNLNGDSKIAVVLLSPLEENKVLTAKVEKKLIKTCSENISTGAEFSAFYLLNVNVILEFANGVAIVNPPDSFAKTKNAVTIDLDGDKTPESFRSCTSMEGAHLFVRTGDAKIGKLRWHKYYYLGYDTEPTCADSEYPDEETLDSR